MQYRSFALGEDKVLLPSSSFGGAERNVLGVVVLFRVIHARLTCLVDVILPLDPVFSICLIGA